MEVLLTKKLNSITKNKQTNKQTNKNPIKSEHFYYCILNYILSLTKVYDLTLNKAETFDHNTK